YARFVFEKNDLAFAFQPWYRIKEDEEKDNNPDIEDYMGNFEFTAAYKLNRHDFSLMLRNSLKFGESRGATQIDWRFPIHERMSGYLQWFNGYGESLIDYNHHVNSVGVGVSLTGWL
ncbi:MAG: phospholipase A, partial [Gammaproteobacteria bacterium]|nr:phospholipase A [Gammaproteobacteria bacterium]